MERTELKDYTYATPKDHRVVWEHACSAVVGCLNHFRIYSETTRSKSHIHKCHYEMSPRTPFAICCCSAKRSWSPFSRRLLSRTSSPDSAATHSIIARLDAFRRYTQFLLHHKKKNRIKSVLVHPSLRRSLILYINSLKFVVENLLVCFAWKCI